jgi:protoheme IX farnesyltransferase
VTAPVAPAIPARATWRDFVELTKPRIVSAGVVAALAGFLAGRPHVDGAALLFALAGIAGITAAAGVLNQVMERDVDARMPRTANRPLPAGRVAVSTATAYGGALAVASLALLATKTPALTTSLAFFAFASYLGVYTPLKRVTTLNTFVGAIPGALPPVLGWTAARGELGAGAFALFAILYLWQLPHFLAIAWLYRSDYEQGGLVMLPARDPQGAMTARQMCLHAVGLCAVSLLPVAFGMAGPVYFAGAVALGVLFLWPSFRFLRAPGEANARRVLLASLVYLPGLLSLIALGW